MRPIDADALIHHFYETEYASMYYIEVVKRIIDEQPTLSPDEVRGVGEWEHQELAPTNWTFCSVCGRQRSKKYKWYYCPNCGARMEVSEDA